MRTKILFRKPTLGGLGDRNSDSRKLSIVHAALHRSFPAVDRVAAALYDAKTGTAATFISHEDRPTGLSRYEARLGDVPSLRRVFRTRRVRIVGDLEVFAKGQGTHTRAIRAAGYKSSATFPIIIDGRVHGFVFFDSRRKHAFPSEDIPLLEVFAQLAAHVALSRVRAAELLRAALRTAVDFLHARDRETGNHVERMARYCRVIAQELSRSGVRRFSDEAIRTIQDFAPLHDVGKICIPDRILLKPGPLEPSERRVMRTHASTGREIVDSILRRFAGGWAGGANALRQIAEHHHEAMDGTGYPHGLCGNEIPIEARIAAVADVFDALTSARSYKDAWPLDRAFAALRRLSRSRLDRDCVKALIRNRRAVEDIRRRFIDAGRLPLSRRKARSSR